MSAVNDLPAVISGTRRQIRELVDGSLEVRIHVDPRFKADFHRLFPQIDTPCAIAPLVLDFERLEQKEEEPKGGALCKLAAMWCRDEEFKMWLGMRLNIDLITDEEAAQALRDLLGIESRKELDNDPEAASRFQAKVRVPFMEWRRAGQR